MDKKESYKDQLDVLQRKQRIKSGLSILSLCIFLFGLGFLYFSYMNADKPNVVVGKALGLVDSSNAKKLDVYIVVELENGNKIQAIFPSNNKFNKGDTVFLQEYTTKAFGGKRYTFIKIKTAIENRES